MFIKKYQQALLAILVLFLLFFLQFLRLLDLSFFNQIANLWKRQNYLVLQKIASPFQRLVTLWHLSAKLEDLQYRYSEAAAVVAEVDTLRSENQELRKLLENSDRSYQQVVVAAPVVSFAQNFVAAGKQNGIKTGAAVLYKGTLLGLIDQVEERQSSVILLSRLRERSILAETANGVKGLVKGDGYQILLTEIAADAPVMVGDLIFSASQLDIEKGLLLGRVARILTNNPALATKTALIEQMVSFYDASLVEIK